MCQFEKVEGEPREDCKEDEKELYFKLLKDKNVIAAEI